MKKTGKKVLLLFSAGYDSTYLAFKNLEEGNDVDLITLNCPNLGGYTSTFQVNAAKKIYDKFFKNLENVTFNLDIIDTPPIFSNFQSLYCPQTIMFLQQAFWYALNKKYDEVQLGFIIGDDSNSFLEDIVNFWKGQFSLMKPNVEIPELTFPIIKLHKSQIINGLKERNISLLYDCVFCEELTENKHYCGECPSCQKALPLLKYVCYDGFFKGLQLVEEEKENIKQLEEAIFLYPKNSYQEYISARIEYESLNTFKRFVSLIYCIEKDSEKTIQLIRNFVQYFCRVEKDNEYKLECFCRETCSELANISFSLSSFLEDTLSPSKQDLLNFFEKDFNYNLSKQDLKEAGLKVSNWYSFATSISFWNLFFIISKSPNKFFLKYFLSFFNVEDVQKLQKDSKSFSKDKRFELLKDFIESSPIFEYYFTKTLDTKNIDCSETDEFYIFIVKLFMENLKVFLPLKTLKNKLLCKDDILSDNLKNIDFSRELKSLQNFLLSFYSSYLPSDVKNLFGKSSLKEESINGEP